MKSRSSRQDVERIVRAEFNRRGPETSKFHEGVEDLVGAEPFVLEGLQETYKERDWLKFDTYVLIASRHPSKTYTEILCEALDSRISMSPDEDIADALGEVADPAAVGSLENAMWWRRDRDEYHNLAIKCTWALGRIVAPESVNALVNAARAAPAAIRESAERLLPSAPPERQIRAAYDDDTVTVYQAYPREIADAALAAGRFVSPFSLQRMTWVKPSFMWMMYRSGWATKPGQERVLAIRVGRAAFDRALALAELASFDARVHAGHDQWQERLRSSPVRVQWDPDRTIRLEKLPWRAIQIGLGPPVSADYATNWVEKITDVTPLVTSLRTAQADNTLDQVNDLHLLLPAERPYPVPPDTAAVLGMTPASSSVAGPNRPGR